MGDECASNHEIRPSQKTSQVESGGPARLFPHLTRGDLPRESAGEVSRGRSSMEVRETGWSKGPKNPETDKGVAPRRKASAR